MANIWFAAHVYVFLSIYTLLATGDVEPLTPWPGCWWSSTGVRRPGCMSPDHQKWKPLRQVHGPVLLQERTTGEIICTMDIPNMWLSILDGILIIFMVAVLLFGPLICTNIFYAQTLDTYHYTVNLKESLHKTVCVTRGPENDVRFEHEHTIDMRTMTTYCKGRAFANELPENKIIPIKIDEFNIDVNYAHLLPENEVHVGLLACLSKAVFFCKMREVPAIGDCCQSSGSVCCAIKIKKKMTLTTGSPHVTLWAACCWSFVFHYPITYALCSIICLR